MPVLCKKHIDKDYYNGDNEMLISQDALDNYFVSNEFNIMTPAIIELQEQVLRWVSDGTPGAIIYGRPRIGKTRAILYIASVLKAKYGRELPIYVLNATEHVVKDKFFYSELLKVVGHSEFDKGTVSALKERLLNSLFTCACNTKYRKIILFIDEAYNFSEKDFKWLMDIYNNLNLKNIHLYVFLVGSEELISRKQALIMAKQHQIVGRFMVEECHFHGIQSAKEMSVCLSNYDQPLEIAGKQISLTKEFFPDAFADGKRLFSCAEVLMKEYLKIMEEIDIPSTSEIPMMYFVNTIKYCLNNYGIMGEKAYFPTNELWKNAIINSGYIAAERLYFNVPIG